LFRGGGASLFHFLNFLPFRLLGDGSACQTMVCGRKLRFPTGFPWEIWEALAAPLANSSNGWSTSDVRAQSDSLAATGLCCEVYTLVHVSQGSWH
jgi:hypothetical protein